MTENERLRIRAAAEAGAAAARKEVDRGFKRLGRYKALGLSDAEWLKKYLGNYIQLAVAERYDAVVAAKAAGLSNRQIARTAGVDEKTIRQGSDRTLKNRSPCGFETAPGAEIQGKRTKSETTCGFKSAPDTSARRDLRHSSSLNVQSPERARARSRKSTR
jgi:hypothetical protein